MIELPNTTYVLLGRCLTPSLSEERREKLIDLFSRDDVRWDRLLREANRQQCTPLWYVRLKEHGVLHLLPADLQAYLAELTAANRTRNHILCDELENIIEILSYAGIPAILLDGTAAFADELYADEGARLIDAMDLLVPREQVREAERLLLMEGYVDAPAKNRLDNQPGQIAPLYHLRKNATVKLHFALAAGSAARLLDTEAAWQEVVAGDISGHAAGWLPPTQRLLYNALHATQSQGAFLRGNLRLADLAEFAALNDRYREDIDWEWFWSRFKAHDLVLECASYAHIVHGLTGDAIDPPFHPKTQWHLAMIAASHLPAVAEPQCGQRRLNYLWHLRARAYYFAQLPGWIWQTICCGHEDGTLWRRLTCFTRKMLDLHFIKRALLTHLP